MFSLTSPYPARRYPPPPPSPPPTPTHPPHRQVREQSYAHPRVDNEIRTQAARLSHPPSQSPTHAHNTFCARYLASKTFAWQHGQFQLDTRRGITYLMDFEQKNEGGSKRFQRIRMFRPISSSVCVVPPTCAACASRVTLNCQLVRRLCVRRV
jgi:hypothetical protein